MFRLDGKIVAVVGAGSGIGEGVALACGAQGAHVACFDINARQRRSRWPSGSGPPAAQPNRA